tara:strand:+ start:2544 stop:3098 length:555 start_codon:yes stop_codon:yes gene_type:complete
MKEIFLGFIFFFFSSYSFGQSSESQNQNVLRINFINPGIEYEYSISNKSKLSTNIGYGISMSYPKLTTIQPTHAFFIAPFIDLHYKTVYNSNKRKNKNKNVEYNAGDFIGLKFNGRGESKNSELTRTDQVDFSIATTWGIQRNYKKINFLFDLGPVYYFDSKGNSGFYPIMLEFNLGYNIWKSE